ncbi:lysine--tRNA ligase [Candidatus Woesearchaeota archaeon]|nr:lysine--tRNA ligase [Candidatus Woesearchaeota archaeon]
MPTEQELIDERVKKLADLRSKGVNPYPYAFTRSHHNADVLSKYKLKPEEKTPDKVAVAGRIVSLRRMGKITFGHILDQSGKLQVYFKEDALKDYDGLKLFDIGDWLGVSGTVFATRSGEITVEVHQFEMLCKSIRPLPDKFHGLKDTELRYRQRYLDLATSEDSRKVAFTRIKIINSIKDLFRQKGFLEVETPILQTIYGGAAARPFVTHHHDLNLQMFLRISPELHLKRLIVGGFEKVFEIGHQFRNEGIDTTHNPEFTSLECYQAYADYHAMMELTEDVYNHVAKEVFGTTTFTYQGKEIDVKKPWKRLTMVQAIKDFAKLDVEKLGDADLKRELQKNRLELPQPWSRGAAIAELFKIVEDQLIQPVFIIDHPIETTPLCKPLRAGKKDFVERFEPYINGWEIGNAYSELNDPIMQRQLLEVQALQLRAGAAEANPMDEDFVRAIEHGMPPTGGLGLGIDRMIMLFTNQVSIRDVMLFPTMKPTEHVAREKTGDAQ